MKPWGLCGSGTLGTGHARSCSLAPASIQGSHLPVPAGGTAGGHGSHTDFGWWSSTISVSFGEEMVMQKMAWE